MNRAFQGATMLLLAAICSGLDMNEDPCLNGKYKTLKDPYRSTGYDHRPTDTARCDDKLHAGWYTFVDVNNAPIQMATTCPGRNNCGTVTPYWMNGNHPTENGIEQRQLCGTSVDPNKSCCEDPSVVFVKKCDRFYVYYLFPIPSCPGSYCAGNMQRCRLGTWSETGFVPCRDLYPILKMPPKVKGPIVNDDQTPEFMCLIEYEKNEADARFEVTWTFDGKPDSNINPIILKGSDRAASLNAQQLQNHVDQEVGCQVASYYEARQQDKNKQIPSSNSVVFGIKEQPELLGPNVRGKTFDFQCRVTFGNDDPDQRIEIAWTFDGTIDAAINSVILNGNRRSITLDGTALMSHINKNIACQARLIFSNNMKTTFRKSTNYYYGITVNPTNVAIQTSDTEKEVTITSSIPIVCDEGQNCCVTFKLEVDKKAVVSIKDICEHKICSADWDPQKRSASVKINVVPIRNQISAGTKQTTLTINILTSGTGQYINIFRNHRLPTVSVTVTIRGGFYCSLTGDPHVIGFDYQHSYHFYTVGDYTVYTVNDRSFTIQIRTWKCWAVTCVCGVVVREQNDIIRVYGCDKPNNLFASVIKIPYELSKGTSVMRSQNGHHIGITLSSGSEIKIDLFNIFMNVYINTPAFDFSKARGVCGTNDGNAMNDFTHLNGEVTPVCPHPGSCQPQPFINSWSVTGDSSLFVKVPPKTKIDNTQNYCPCDSAQSSATCSHSQHGKNTATVCKDCIEITNMIRPEPGINFPVIAVNSDKQWSSAYDLFEDETNNERHRRASNEAVADGNLKWPNSQGIKEDQAKEMCNKSISSAQLFTQCENDKTVMDNSISDCLNDILFGDTTETVNLMQATFTVQCQQLLARDEKNYEEVDGDFVMKKALADFVCSTECLDHGTCGKDGSCLCRSGWEGDACHIEAGKGPQISWTNSRESICYAINKACDSVDLDVSNANLMDPLKCQVYTLDNLNNKRGDPVISDAVREGSPGAKCSLPQTGASTLNFTITVSRDGKLYSNEVFISTYDSTCLSCTKSGCVELKTACHINNHCYKNGERSKNNAGLICDVSKQTSAWSQAPNSGRAIATLHPWTNILAVLLIALSAWNTINSVF